MIFDLALKGGRITSMYLRTEYVRYIVLAVLPYGYESYL